MTQDAQSKQDTTQLLVPKSRREMLFQAAHCNPMAGHLGQAATLNLMLRGAGLTANPKKCAIGRVESGSGGMWRGGRGSAKSAAGERLRRQW